MIVLRSVLKMVLMGLPVVIAVLLLYSLLLKKQPLSMKMRLRKAFVFIPIVIAVTVIGGIGMLLYQKTGEAMSSSFRIGYNYPEASKGLTPSGVHLDASEILSDEVLTAAIGAGGWSGITAEDLKSTLNVTNLNPQDSVSAERQYLSTEYQVSYKASPQTRHLDAKEVCAVLSQTYYDYFIEKYGRKYNVLNSDFTAVADLDYLDTYAYLRSRINNIADYMTMCSSAQSASFVSPETQESFESVAEKARTYRNNALERYRAYVLKYGISKDKGQYISRLNYDNRILNMSYMKNLVAYSVRLSAIDIYARDITTAVLVPTRDDDGEYYQSRTKIGTDYFAEDANQYLGHVTGRQLEIETNNMEIQSLLGATASSSNIQRADAMIAELQSQIGQIAQLAALTIQDYDNRHTNGYMSLTSGENRGRLSGFEDVAKYAALMFLLSSATAMAAAGVRKGKKAEVA